MKSSIKNILEPLREKKGALIAILQQVQDKYGYLPQEVLSMIADELKLSEHEIYGVATFYAQFRFNKPGKYQIRACAGTACHVRGGKRIMDTIEQELHITHGETTDDGLFSLERVACMGCCALAPVMVVNDTVYVSCTTTKVREILKKYRDGE